MVIAILEWQKTRHELSLMKDFLVPNNPSASLRSALLAAARSLAALTAHRAVIHYRSLGCGFALPTPYTSAILRSCKARLLPSAAKQNSILNRQRFNEESLTHVVTDMFYRPN